MFALDEAERKKRCVLFMLKTVNYSRVMAIVALECKYKWREDPYGLLTCQVLSPCLESHGASM